MEQTLQARCIPSDIRIDPPGGLDSLAFDDDASDASDRDDLTNRGGNRCDSRDDATQLNAPTASQASVATRLPQTGTEWHVPGRSCGSRTPWSTFRTTSGTFRTTSVPMLPAPTSTHATTWRCRGQPVWRSNSWAPLGGTFRDWDSAGGNWQAEDGTWKTSRVRKDADDGGPYINGCVPHWGKQSQTRNRGVLEHELSWAYYRMQRHINHPQRKQVGDPYLPGTSVVQEMRSGFGGRFQFWRDLRPPFHLPELPRRIQEDKLPPGVKHPDGELYEITYECAIAYDAERKWNTQSDGGTFDNKMRGVAQVRLPENFPKVRPMLIVSWGNPTLNPVPTDAVENTAVDPSKWMSISEELGLRADNPRFAQVRELTRRAHSRKDFHMPPLQKVLLGPHPSLARLAKTMEAEGDPATHTSNRKGHGVPEVKPPKMRKHRMWTQAAGFVGYNG